LREYLINAEHDNDLQPVYCLGTLNLVHGVHVGVQSRNRCEMECITIPRGEDESDQIESGQAAMDSVHPLL
jgi:hypothetical protein